MFSPPLEIVHTLEIVGIIIEVDKHPCIVINLYRHSGTKTPEAIFSALLEISNTYPQVILVGDFNAHHLSWGCGSSDFRELSTQIRNSSQLLHHK